MSEIGRAFVRFDGFDEVTDVSPRIIERSLLGLAHPMLDLGEGLFNRVEVG